MDLNEIHVGWIVRDGTDDAKERFKRAVNEKVNKHEIKDSDELIATVNSDDKEINVTFNSEMSTDNITEKVSQAAIEFLNLVKDAVEEEGSTSKAIVTIDGIGESIDLNNIEATDIINIATEILSENNISDKEGIEAFLKGDGTIAINFSAEITIGEDNFKLEGKKVNFKASTLTK